jgi:hypothetical protein
MRETSDQAQHQGGEDPQAPQLRPFTGEPEIRHDAMMPYRVGRFHGFNTDELNGEYDDKPS